MQARYWISLFCVVFCSIAGCSTSPTSLGYANQRDLSKPSTPYPSKGAILEALINYLFHIHPSAYRGQLPSTRWNDELLSADEFTQGTPKRLYYAPRAGKRSVTNDYADDEKTKEEASKASSEGSRWKRSTEEPAQQVEEKEDSRPKRETSEPENDGAEELDSNSWWWSQAAVRRSPFSPRLGKRDELHYSMMYDNDDDSTDIYNLKRDDADDNNFVADLMSDDYISEEEEAAVSPQRLAVRSALVPRLGKRDFSFSPRLGKRGNAFSPRLGKRADFAFSPRLGKRADFAFSPRLGKKADFSFSPRLGKRKDFAFSPRLGKKADFAFSPRLGKRGDFAFSPRLGKKADFAFSPRLGKRGNAFIPRLGKRETTKTSSTEDTWSDKMQLKPRAIAFSPRLG